MNMLQMFSSVNSEITMSYTWSDTQVTEADLKIEKL